MIIVKKPFRYLRDMHKFSYHEYKHGRSFLDEGRIMLFEKRETMTCKAFVDSDNIPTIDAGYKTFSLIEFFGNCEFGHHWGWRKGVFRCKFSESKWCLPLIKIGLKVVRNAEICLATSIDFPLIIRNEKYNFYIAPRINKNDLNDLEEEDD